MFAVEDGDIQTLAVGSGRLFQIPESDEMSYICQREVPAEGKLETCPIALSFEHLIFLCSQDVLWRTMRWRTLA